MLRFYEQKGRKIYFGMMIAFIIMISFVVYAGKFFALTSSEITTTVSTNTAEGRPE